MSRARRGRGEGSVCQRTDGMWVGAASGGIDQHGKRTRKYVYALTKAECLLKLRDVQLRAGTLHLKGARVKFAEHLDEWLRIVAKPKVRESTYTNYARVTRLHVKPAIGNLPVDKIEARHVESMLADMVAAEKSSNTRRLAFVVVNLALATAVKWKMIPYNPAASVDAPQAEREKPLTVVTEDDLKAILKAATDDRLEALYVLGVGSGLRLGELFGLHWSHVDLAAGTLNVVYSLTEIDGRLTLTPPKSKQSRRLVHLPAVCVVALEEHRKRQFKAGFGGSEYVFTDQHGGPMRRSHFHADEWHPLLERAGLEEAGVRFHDLRHLHASLLFAEGCSVQVVAARLGHSKASFTVNTYGHMLPGASAEAADKIESAMKRAAPKPRRKRTKGA